MTTGPSADAEERAIVYHFKKYDLLDGRYSKYYFFISDRDTLIATKDLVWKGIDIAEGKHQCIQSVRNIVKNAKRNNVSYLEDRSIANYTEASLSIADTDEFIALARKLKSREYVATEKESLEDKVLAIIMKISH